VEGLASSSSSKREECESSDCRVSCWSRRSLISSPIRQETYSSKPYSFGGGSDGRLGRFISTTQAHPSTTRHSSDCSPMLIISILIQQEKMFLLVYGKYPKNYDLSARNICKYLSQTLCFLNSHCTLVALFIGITISKCLFTTYICPPRHIQVPFPCVCFGILHSRNFSIFAGITSLSKMLLCISYT